MLVFREKVVGANFLQYKLKQSWSLFLLRDSRIYCK
jgi:hypothetical protein